MNAVTAHRPRGRLAVVVLLILVVAVAVAVALLWPRLEAQPPQITLSSQAETLGRAPLEVVVSDAGAGLRSVAVTLSQGGVEKSLAAEQFAPAVATKQLTIDPTKLEGLREGPAQLRVVARDASLWRLLRGNEAVLDKQLTIDLTPPKLELVADDRYVNFGGVGAIVYRTSPDTATSGVRFGERFYPGVAGQVEGRPDEMLALFAHAYDVPPDARPVLVATDQAGNTRELRLNYELKDVKYRKSTLAISDAFLQNKVAPLLSDPAARQRSPKEVFVAVNHALRKENEDRIRAITSKVTPKRQWEGAFVQLSNSKVEANFADQRTYTYGGETIDTAYHLGYDLSVTKHYPVEAANRGTVAFAGDLGIYGNTVILDHGLGLYTLYGHLSAIDVKEGDTVDKRQVLGRTGETGLAAGDHLHFGVYLDGVAVLPVEWWDPKWIEANLTPKLAGHGGNEAAAAPAAAPKAAARGAGAKKRR